MGILKYFTKKKNVESEDIVAKTNKEKDKVENSVEINNYRKFCENPFKEQYQGIENYLQINQFERIKEMSLILQLMAEQNLYSEQTAELNAKLASTIQRKQELEVAAKQLESIRVPLTKEILDFTKIVREVGERYKLSPNWEGKKPLLIDKQKELEQRRDAYEKNEKQLDVCFVAFYKEVAQLDCSIRKLCEQMLK